MTAKILCLVLILPLFSIGQEEYSFRKEASFSSQMVNALSTRYKSDLTTLKGEYKKYLEEIYKERFEVLKEIFNSPEIVTDTEATSYLNGIAREIISKNPVLQASELRIVFSQDLTPNASSQGEGTILFHLGLFHRLQNESEVAFVLCHELAHYHLNHGNRNIEKYVSTFYSDEFQKELKQISKSEYGQNKKLNALGQKLVFRNRRHSREDEASADSMAMIFMKNTGYDLEGAVSTLHFLDTVKNNKFYGPLHLNTRFSFAQYPFKKSWLESDVISFTSENNDKEKPVEDSLKTHPDCKLRIEHIQKWKEGGTETGRKKFIVSQSDFESLQKKYDFARLEYCLDMENYSLCLYYTLQMLNHYPDNAYLHMMVGKCWNEIYARQKSHKLGQIVNLPGPNWDKEYNALLQMIQNLRLREIASIAYYYVHHHEHLAGKHREFASVMQKSTENFNN